MQRYDLFLNPARVFANLVPKNASFLMQINPLCPQTHKFITS